MTAEHFGAAAIVGEGDDGADRLILAHVGTEIALESPECGDHRGRHAILLLGAREDFRMLFHLRLTRRNAALRHHPLGKFHEGLREYALALVDADNARIVSEEGFGLCQGTRRDALRQCFLLDLREPRRERPVGAAGNGGECRAACHQEYCARSRKPQTAGFQNTVFHVRRPPHAKAPEIPAASALVGDSATRNQERVNAGVNGDPR